VCRNVPSPSLRSAAFNLAGQLPSLGNADNSVVAANANFVDSIDDCADDIRIEREPATALTPTLPIEPARMVPSFPPPLQLQRLSPSRCIPCETITTRLALLPERWHGELKLALLRGVRHSV
jgi:hypothetical protein